MSKLAQITEENQASRLCPDCGKAVDQTKPCWLRISPNPTRTRAWHLDCRDRLLREQQEQFQAALRLLTEATQAAAEIAKGSAKLQDLLGGKV